MSFLRKTWQVLNAPISWEKLPGWLKFFIISVLVTIGIFIFALLYLLILEPVIEDRNALYLYPENTINQKRFDISLQIWKEAVGSIATIATISGGIILYLNFRTATQQTKIANENAQTAESRLITDRFSKAVEQLGNEAIEVRLGGIYALERVAQDSDRDYWTIMEVLTSFIQENSPLINEEQIKTKAYEISQKNRRNSSDEENWNKAKEELETRPIEKDIQAALTVIRRRDQYAKNNKYSDFYLKNLYLDISKVHLEGVNLEGANLYCANLYSANLKGVKLTGANLYSANLIGAKLTGANLKGANLKDANLTGANLTIANLTGAKLTGVYLKGANLEAANLKDAKLIGANLTGANLINVNNLVPSQIKSARSWDKAIYKGSWHSDRQKWIVDKEANQSYIDSLKNI